MVKKIYLGILILVILTASIYVLLPDKVRIDVGTTYSTFKVYEDDSWVLAGTERTILWDGTKKMRASDRVVNYTIDGNTTKIYRYAYFKEGCTVVDTYSFDGNIKDISLVPISHKIETNNCVGFLLNYQVVNLEYFGNTTYDLKNPSSFGHNMKVEWEPKNYYERIYKYKYRDEGKLDIKYRINSSEYSINVRLFDPVWNIKGNTVYVNDSNIFISATPHTVTDGGWVVYNFTSKVYTGNVDMVFGFDTESTRPQAIELYNPTNETREVSYTCDYEFNYTTSPNYFWCYRSEEETSNGTIPFRMIKEGSFDYGDVTLKTATWIENYVDEWKDYSSTFNSINYDYQDMNKWWYNKNIPIIKDKEYIFRVKINLLENNFNEPKRKYWFAIKPSSETISEAIGNGHLYSLDPWTSGLNEDIYLYFALEESSGAVIDSVAGLNTTTTGTQGATGKVGNCVDLDSNVIGSATYKPYTASINAGSLNFWINTTDAHYLAFAQDGSGEVNNVDTVIGAGASASTPYCSATDKFCMTINRVITVETAKSNIDDGNWHMVTITVDGTTHRMYIDGVNVDNATTGDNIFGGSSGNNGFQFGEILTGSLDELGVWNRSLTTGEVNQLWNNGDGITYGLDQPPEVTLNTPVNTSNFSTSSVVFGGIVTDDINLTEVSLIIDNVYNETNTSGINNSNYTFTKIFADEDYVWTYEGCDSESQCTNATARTFTIDTTKPLISYNSPTDSNGSLVSRNWIFVNVTATDTHLDSVRMDFDGTNETFATNEGNNYWENKTSLSDGTHSFYAWVNDTFGHYNFTANYTVEIDTTAPLVEYVDPTGSNVSSYNRSWIFVNVSVTESNEENITFNLYHQNSTFINSSTYTDSKRTINWTMGYGTYIYNVTVWDQFNKSNSTSTRTIYLSNIFLFLESAQTNTTAELGSVIEILSNSTLNFGDIYLDVDHPSYGTNYNSSSLEVLLNITIDWFRKILFSDGSSSKEYNFTGTYDTNYLNFSSHQYDEIVNMSINISSTTDVQDPVFYRMNTTVIDRAYYGYLVGQNMYVNKVYDNSNGTSLYLTATNLTFSDISDKTVYFYMDDNSNFINLSFNATGVEYGFEVNDSFPIDFDYADKAESTSLMLGGLILTSGIDPIDFIYDTFGDDTINTTHWSLAYNNGSFGGGGDDFSWTIDNKETGGYLELSVDNFEEDYSGENKGTRELTNYIFANYSLLNSWTPRNISFGLAYSTTGWEENDRQECDYYHQIKLGNVEVWESHSDYCVDYQGNLVWADCYEYAQTISTLYFNLSRQENNSWLVEISGLEKTYGEWKPLEAYDCGEFEKYYDYTEGTWNFSTTNPGAGAECAADSGTLSNSYLIEDIEWNWAAQFYMNQYVKGEYDAGDGEGCASINTWLRVYSVDSTLYNLTNGTYISESIYNSPGDIASAALDVSGYTPPGSGETATLYLSADNGVNWELVTDGVEHSFSNPGKDIKLKITYDVKEGGYKNTTSFIYDLFINTTQSYPSDVTFDFGNDGIDEYTFTGEFNSSNSPVMVDLSSAILTGAFTGDADVGSHTYLVPLVIGTSEKGQVNIEGINLTYNPHPIMLNSNSIQNYLGTWGANETNFSIKSLATDGNFTVSDIRFDYAGGNDTIEILAHNSEYTINMSRWITYYYSRWDYEFVPTNVDWLEFIPSGPIDSDVEPFGQYALGNLSILNLTNYGYGGIDTNLSIYLNDTETCVNLTMSLDNNKSHGDILTTSWINLDDLSYLEAVDIYMWADYNCSYSNWTLFYPHLYFRQCCDGCVCDEDLT